MAKKTGKNNTKPAPSPAQKASASRRQAFENQIGSRRLVLLTTKGAVPYTEFSFNPSDIIMVGRESAGVPNDIHARADARVIIPMVQGVRSLNVAVSAAMVLGEALRQTTQPIEN